VGTYFGYAAYRRLGSRTCFPARAVVSPPSQ
jgi:hypothetical protein